VVALNKKSGELVWKCAVPEGDQAAYASGIVMEAEGVRQYVFFLQKGLVGVEAKTGQLLWRYDQTAQNSPAVIPTPVASGNLIFSSAARRGGGLVKLTSDGGRVKAEEAYFSAKMPSSIGGVVKVGDYLYGTAGPTLQCIEFESGDLKWDERSPAAPGALCYADGRLYLRGEEGSVALVEASPEGYQEKGHFTPPDGPDRGTSKAWSYPVVADGRLYLHDLGTVWCYDVRAR
jgi:outer membrane protein assembly factor BamB